VCSPAIRFARRICSGRVEWQEDPGGDGRPRARLARDAPQVNHIPAAKPTSCSTLSDKFAGYGFHKSHPPPMPWSPTTPPVEIRTTRPYSMSASGLRQTNTDNLRSSRYMRRMGVPGLAALINVSESDTYRPRRSASASRWASLKNVGGKGRWNTLCIERIANGPFPCSTISPDRIGPAPAHRRHLETLAAAAPLICFAPEPGRRVHRGRDHPWLMPPASTRGERAGGFVLLRPRHRQAASACSAG